MKNQLAPLILVKLFKKTQYNTDKLGLEKKTDDADNKIPDNIGLLKKTDYQC